MKKNIIISLEDLEISEDSKKIIESTSYIPVMMINDKLAVIDEAFFLLPKVEESVKKVFYEYVVAINQYLNNITN